MKDVLKGRLYSEGERGRGQGLQVYEDICHRQDNEWV